MERFIKQETLKFAMTYNFGMRLQNGLGYAMTLSDSQGTLDPHAPNDVVKKVQGKNWAKNFVIPKNPDKDYTQDFLLTGSGNLGLLYRGRQKLMEHGRLSSIDQVTEILLDHIWESKNGSDAQISGFIVAGPTRDKELGLVHIDDALHESGYKNCVVSAQGGSGFDQIDLALQSHKKNRGNFATDTIDYATTLAMQLARYVAENDPQVNQNLQLMIMKYDGKRTKVGMLYPAGTFLSEDKFTASKFSRDYIEIMSGLLDVGPEPKSWSEPGQFGERDVKKFLMKKGLVDSSQVDDENVVATKNDLLELDMLTAFNQAETYDRIMASLSFLTENPETNTHNEHMARSFLSLGLTALLDKSQGSFIETSKKFRPLASRIVGTQGLSSFSSPTM